MALSATRVLAVAALALAALMAQPTAAVYKRTCEERFPDQYAVVKAKMQTCEDATKITMALPLTVKQKQALCSKCTDLAEMTQADNWPACTVVSEGVATNLRVQFRNFFRPCSTASSDDGSKPDDDAKPATVAPTSGGNGGAPAATESLTAPDTSASSKTPKPSKTPKASKAATTKEDSDDGSGSTGTKASKTPKPTTKVPKTPKPKTPKANRNGTSASNGTDASTSSDADSEANDADGAASKSTKLKSKTNSTLPGNTTTQSKASTDSGISTGAIAGIIAGVVALVMVSAAFVVLRHRRKHSSASDKRPAAELAAYDANGRAISSFSPANPFQFSMASTATNASGSVMHAPPDFAASYSSVASSMAPAPTCLWEDEVIIAARVPKDKVVPTVLIARGAYGEVYQGLYNRQHVAIKTLLPETRKDLQEINALLAEVKLMATLEHERIVTFIGVAWDSLTDICVLSEFMEGGDLRGLVMRFEADRRPHSFDHDKIKIALHVAHALTYLHSLRPIVLHRDLKSKNILLNSHLNAKLTDFGVSRESSYRTMTAGVGTSLWMAPEVMLGGRYDEKADVFSFGVVLSELDWHTMPYENVRETETGKRLPDNALLQLVAGGQLSVVFSSDDESTSEIAALGRACVSVDPTDRPTAVNVLYALHSALKSAYVVM